MAFKPDIPDGAPSLSPEKLEEEIEDAKKMFTRIEECALLSEQVRKTCEEMRNKIAGVPV
jgi:hypothetical protein